MTPTSPDMVLYALLTLIHNALLKSFCKRLRFSTILCHTGAAYRICECTTLVRIRLLDDLGPRIFGINEDSAVTVLSALAAILLTCSSKVSLLSSHTPRYFNALLDPTSDPKIYLYAPKVTWHCI